LLVYHHSLLLFSYYYHHHHHHLHHLHHQINIIIVIKQLLPVAIPRCKLETRLVNQTDRSFLPAVGVSQPLLGV
jgi:hypothetical protein